jgi:hypothetical protein
MLDHENQFPVDSHSYSGFLAFRSDMSNGRTGLSHSDRAIRPCGSYIDCGELVTITGATVILVLIIDIVFVFVWCYIFG